MSWLLSSLHIFMLFAVSKQIFNQVRFHRLDSSMSLTNFTKTILNLNDLKLIVFNDHIILLAINGSTTNANL